MSFESYRSAISSERDARIDAVKDRLMGKVDAVLVRHDGVLGCCRVRYTQRLVIVYRWSDLEDEFPPSEYRWNGELDEEGRRVYRP